MSTVAQANAELLEMCSILAMVLGHGEHRPMLALNHPRLNA